MVLESYFPPDIRVEKEAETLIREGYEVYLLSLGKVGSPKMENIGGINVIRTSYRGLLSRVWRFFWFNMCFCNPIIRRSLYNIIKQNRIDVIHVHDLPLVKTAVSVAKKFDIPVIADLHENYPEAIRMWRKKRNLKKRVLDIVTPIYRWKKLEKSVLQNVERIITVVDEAKEHYVNDCRVPSQKVTVVMNTVDLEEFDKLNACWSLIEKYKNYFVISYIGGFGPHRGLDTAIKSMPKILGEIPNAKLLLIGGKASEYEMYLREMCKKLKVENNVEFTGWVDFSLVPSYIAASDVCLVPHHSSAHTNTTIPHKLFQYMAMKKPVVVTDCKPLKRIVEECKCGIVVPSGDHRRLAEAVVRLYRNRDLAETFGKNGRKCVELKYNWRNEAEKLISVYREVIKCKE